MGYAPPAQIVGANDGDAMTGIPYNWGGFDSPWSRSDNQSWKSWKEALGYYANSGPIVGRIDTDNPTWNGTNTAGIDCSGFVAAAANYIPAAKPGTGALLRDTYAHPLIVDASALRRVLNLQPMDHFVSTTHTFYYVHGAPDADEIATLESAVTGTMDGAQEYQRTWKEAADYVYRSLWDRAEGDAPDVAKTTLGSGSARMGLPGQSVWYKLESAAAGTTIQLSGITGGDASLYLYDSTYHLIDPTVADQTKQTVTIPSGSSGPFYVRVYVSAVVSASAGVHYTIGEQLSQPLPASTYPANWSFSEGRRNLGVSITPAMYMLNGTVAEDSAAFTVPTAAQSLRFLYQASDSRDGNGNAPVCIEVLSADGSAVRGRVDNGFIVGSSHHGFKIGVVDIQAYRGETIRLRFRNEHWSGKSEVKSLTLNVETPSWTPSDASQAEIAEDGFQLPEGTGYLHLTGATSATSSAFTVPAAAQSLRFDYMMGDYRDGDQSGVLYVEVLGGPTFGVIERIDGDAIQGTLNQGWKTGVLDLQSYQGQAIKLRFRNSHWSGKSRIDNVTLNIETPGWTPSDCRLVQLSNATAPADSGSSAPANATFEPSAARVSSEPVNRTFSQGRQTLQVNITPTSYLLDGNAAQQSSAFLVPADAQSLRLEYLTGDQRDGNGNAVVHVEVLSGPDFSVVTRIDADALQGTTNQGWKQGVLDMQVFQKQTVKLRLRNWDWPGKSQVKNLSLNVETPAWSSSHAPYAQIKDDGYRRSGSSAYLELTGATSVTSSAFAMPVGAQSLRLHYVMGDYRDGNASGTLLVEVLGGPDFSVVTRVDGDTVQGTANQGWREAVLDLQKHQGRTIKLRFRNWQWSGKSRIDNIGLHVETDRWVSSSGGAVTLDAAPEPSDPGVTAPENASFSQQSAPAGASPANGGFDEGRQNLPVSVTPASYALEGTAAVESAAFTVPTTAQSLRLQYQTGDHRDGNSDAIVYVEVLSGPDFSIVTRIDAETIRGAANQGWKRSVLDLQAFQGKTIKLRLRNWHWAGRSMVNDLTVNVETPAWTSSDAPHAQIVTDTHSPTHSGHLVLTGANSATSSAFAIAANAHCLRFEYVVGDSRDNYANGALYVEVLSGPDFSIVTLTELQSTLQQGWKLGRVDLRAFQGQVIKVRFRNWSWPGKSFIDDLLVYAETPGWNPSSAQAVQVLSDGNGHPSGGPYLQIDGAHGATSTAFRVPATAQTLDFNYVIGDSGSDSAEGELYVEVLSGTGFSVPTRIDQSILRGSLSQGWKHGSLDIKAFRGRTVQLRFRNESWRFRSRIDAVAILQEPGGGTKFIPAPAGSGTHLKLIGANSATSTPFKVNTDTLSLRADVMTGDYRDGNSDGLLYVEVLSGPDFSVVTRIDAELSRGTLNQGWKVLTLDMQRFRGRTIQLRFRNWHWPGMTLVDNVTLAAGASGPLPSATDANPAPTYLVLRGAAWVAGKPFTVSAQNASLGFSYLTGDSRDGYAEGTLYVEARPISSQSWTRIDHDQLRGTLTDGWKQGTADLSAYMGQSIQLRFRNWHWPGFTRLSVKQ